ncbi:alpha/beta hydrolase [Ectopseudomonas mendocina]|uniref:Alpha/beta hydrolase n=2 Tax=Ectopseudomonas mendocina TaxID=300 RepID=A0ABD7RV99_ECTME|nr:alpha/beta hydrolase [Pseudomonas mendocina]MBL0949731.1 alpha/beta hydrolase [Pseudomonas sp.]ALN17319.1 alpha/beta hydrolase [Pseudomonas mendocina S5.2]KES01871.1 alpha/beta hydrolase [Pseudomonas mendocina]TRO10813.1 alpha/beta hydrolase [Pseudomonas mendocina]TRO17895.1 alpha/beta hydrolase [Pseudomonas mendocina]
MASEAIRYLILPGWQGSSEEHWQSHWHRSLPGSVRVEQNDWFNPQRADWIAELDRVLAADPRPAILIAHSLGCVTVAHWAAQAPVELLRRVRGALLVAPADVERPGCPEPLRNFAPMPRDLLPFPSLLVGSDNDAAASALRALELARAWGSEAAILTGAGHINVKSGHRYWEQGFAYLYRLQGRIEQQARLRA